MGEDFGPVHGDSMGTNVSGAERVVITDEIRAHLRAQKARTGLGTTRFLRGAIGVPAALNPQMIESWIRGDAKTARPDHLRFVLVEWNLQPTVEIVEITPAVRSTLHKEKDRTGCGVIRLLQDTPGTPA